MLVLIYAGLPLVYSQPVSYNPYRVKRLFNRRCVSDILNVRYLHYNS